ncbi:MAG: hypothetical protein Q7S61_04270 [bacterium]|nr:hypothetical protein [bacterium]
MKRFILTSKSVFFVFTAFFLFLIFGLANFKVTTTLISSSRQAVLGDEDKKEEEKKSEEKQREESKKQEEQKGEENKKEQEKNTVQPQKSSTTSTTTNKGSSTQESSFNNNRKSTEFEIQQEGLKRETEVVNSDGKKVKTKIEDDGRIKIEVEDEKLKIKYTFENGKLKINAENKQGDEVKVSNEKLEKLRENAENELEKEDVKIATREGELSVTKNKITAMSQFPLSIDPITRTLQVTTPAGVKLVTILPDQALQKMLDLGVLSKVNSTETGTGEKIKIDVRNGEVVYKISGKKEHKLLGFIPIKTTKEIVISSETGTPLTQEQSLLSSFIDFLSPD